MKELIERESSDLVDRLKKRASQVTERPLEEVCPILVDTSSSMASSAGEGSFSKMQAVHLAIPLLEGRGHYIEYGLVGFGNSATRIQNLTQSFSSVRFQVEFMQPEGMTAMVPAMEEGLRMISERVLKLTTKKRMVMLTDGCGNEHQERLQQVLLQCKEMGVMVDTIAFGRDADETTLMNISSSTGGKFQRANSPAELEAAYQKLNFNVRYLEHKNGGN
jgi:Mg-chelatase subunit ChlD